MNTMKRCLAVISLFLFLLAAPPEGRSYSLSAWGSMTGAKTLAFNPIFYGAFDPEFSMTADVVLSYGFSDAFDAYINLASLDVMPESGYAGSWIMPRYDLGGNNILALQFGLVSNGDTTSSYLVPQYHYFKEGEKFAWEINAGVNVPLDDAENSLIFGIIAPVWKIVPGTLSLYLEVDPSYQLGEAGDFILTLVPGLCLGFGSEGQHQLCFGFPVSDLTESETSVSWGAWFWTTF